MLRSFPYWKNLRLHDFKTDDTLLAGLIERNVSIKTTVVVADEFEQGDRKLLNFWTYHWTCHRKYAPAAAWPCHKYWYGTGM